MMQCPSKLVYISDYDVGSSCYSASHREDGDILVGAEAGVKLFSHDKKAFTGYNTPHTKVTTVIARRKNNYLIYREGSINKIDMTLADKVEMRDQLFEFGRMESSIESSTLAVSDKYAVVTNPDTSNLIIYDFINKTTKSYRPAFELLGLHFLPDGDLLAASNGSLRRYSLKSGEPKELWVCDDLDHCYGVSSGSDGLIYVGTAYDTRKIYIVSPEGKKLKELTHPKLPSIGSYISVKDDELAVPGWYDKKLHLFRLM